MSSLALKASIAGGGGGASQPLYVDDVFSTYLYTGNGSTQTINNGIDLAGRGGMVWIKRRNGSYDNLLCDTIRYQSGYLSSNTTAGQVGGDVRVTNYYSTGFAINNGLSINDSAGTYASWTFRKAPKFFDVVTYTGDGGVVRQIPHNLGIEPGMIIVKATSTTNNWFVYHTSLGATKNLKLNLADAAVTDVFPWNNQEPTASVFTVNNGANSLNASGVTYVAYLFAHDPSADGIIQCGSFTGVGFANFSSVNLGWEPQFILVKAATTSGFVAESNWRMIDTMRGWTADGSMQGLYSNSAAAETSGSGYFKPTATGFDFKGTSGVVFIYLAIRRPNKPPTTGTQVFAPYTYSEPISGNQNVGFAPDMAIQIRRSGDVRVAWDKLRGNTASLYTNSAAAENAEYSGVSYPFGGFSNTGFTSGFLFNNASGTASEALLFRRAPGFFDVVCYTGTGSGAQTISHNLRATPELIITRARNSADDWYTYSVATGNTLALFVNGNVPAQGPNSGYWNNTSPTATAFTAGSYRNGIATYIAYLFASLPGVSKVGSYTGNGSSQTINCGFSAGARFFLVKATSTTGNWWVFDSARGVVASFDPALALNSTAAEITSADAVDPDPTGIIVNQEATCSINATGVSYVYLAIA